MPSMRPVHLCTCSDMVYLRGNVVDCVARSADALLQSLLLQSLRWRCDHSTLCMRCCNTYR